MSAQCTTRFDEERVDGVFATFDQCSLPGVAVGISIAGRPVYRKGFGLASMELPVVLSPGIRMRIGSTSKHFASAAYLRLCEAGRAGLEDTVGSFLPELPASVRGITMRQLMGHLGGLRDVFDITWQFSGSDRFVSSGELASMYRDIDDWNAPPGQTWIYSNGGYLLLSLAIERITGLSFEDALRQWLFDPIGLHSTLVRRSERRFVPNSATLHAMGESGGFEKSAFFGTEFLGEGGVASTIDDMLRWLSHMDEPTVGSRELWQMLSRPLRVDNGTSTRYGLGLFAGTYRGVDIVHHPGGGMGGSAQALKVPSVGLDVIVMTNRGDVSPMLLVEQVLDVVLEGLDEVPAQSSNECASGLYFSARTGRTVQLVERSGQQIANIDGMDVPFRSCDDGLLRPIGVFQYAQQTIELRGSATAPSRIVFRDCGNPDELERQEPTSDEDAPAIFGRYRSDRTRTDVTILRTDAGARLLTQGRFGSLSFDLVQLTPRIWRAMPTRTALGGVLAFDADGDRFRFSCPRTWALPFRRFA